MRVFLVIALLAVAAPAMAKTVSPDGPVSPGAANQDAKTDPNKPYVYDSARKQAPARNRQKWYDQPMPSTENTASGQAGGNPLQP